MPIHEKTPKLIIVIVMVIGYFFMTASYESLDEETMNAINLFGKSTIGAGVFIMVYDAFKKE